MIKAKLNPNKEIVAEVTAALKDSNGFCPCTLIRDNPDYKCQCKAFRDMLTEEHIGETCHCGLFVVCKVKE